MMKFIRFEFLPPKADVGLLILRVWLGASIFLLHGLGKLGNVFAGEFKFADPIGIGVTASLILSAFAEGICSIFLALGLFARMAALVLVINMAVAFWFVHGAKLSGQGSGELAFLYLAGFVTVFLAGAGKYSVDRK